MIKKNRSSMNVRKRSLPTKKRPSNFGDGSYYDQRDSLAKAKRSSGIRRGTKRVVTNPGNTRNITGKKIEKVGRRVSVRSPSAKSKKATAHWKEMRKK